jgi:hemolysin III
MSIKGTIMSMSSLLSPPHYPTSAAKKADLIVHIVGLIFALFGGGLLLGLSVGLGRLTQTAALSVYAAGLLAMLAFSTAYNFANDRWRPIMRRLDHAGIFLMIAGSYTPFTTQNLTGAWAWGMTIAVWTIAGLGAIAKLFLPGLGKRFWIGVYLALSWVVLIAAKPMIAAIPWIALMLLLIGGAVYSLGVTFYVSKRLKFKRAIWHGHVIAAAGTHWAAVLIGVVLTR